MLEIGSSGSVGERGGNDPLYPEFCKSCATQKHLIYTVGCHMDFDTLKKKRRKNVQEQIFILYYEQVVKDSPTPPTITVDNGSQS
jgi:hypothetical protein